MVNIRIARTRAETQQQLKQKYNFQRPGERVVEIIFTVSPREFEQYSLLVRPQKLLVSRFFQDLHIVEGVVYPTYQEIRAILRLFSDDDDSKRVIRDFFKSSSPHFPTLL